MRQVTLRTNDHYISPPRETNLKVRQALPATAELGDSEDQLSAFNGMLVNICTVYVFMWPNKLVWGTCTCTLYCLDKLAI